MSQIKYPIGIQSFEKLRRDGYVYVDKTELIYRLVSTCSYCFLSRPRRFGKSLLMSTLEAYFSGRRELFEGLAIDSLTEEWNEYPVLHLDLSGEDYTRENSLENSLMTFLDECEKVYGVSTYNPSVSRRFELLIKHISNQTGRQVVILVDEYDKPLLMNAHDAERQDRIRATLKAFYGVMKSCDAHIRFGMLTGVTKFSKVSVFSDLNNLKDITLDGRYDTLCGITPEEITEYFSEGVSELADFRNINEEECLALLRDNYDGYHFSSALRDVYNPFSLLNALDSARIGSYWFETGTPTFLVEKIKREDIDLNDFENERIQAKRMMNVDLISDDVIPVLFQSGYLTIKGYDAMFDEYVLGYPNREVKEGFLSMLVPLYTPRSGGKSPFSVRSFAREVMGGDPESFMKRLGALFSGFPYDQVMDCERHYHNVVYLTMKLMGFYVSSEYRTSDGRCDAVVQTDRYIYIFEFKYDRSAREAIEQIEQKRYAAPFAADPRRLFRIGVNFSSRTRTIDDYIIE